MSKHKAPSQRMLKAGELIRRMLAEIIAKEHFRDPELQGVSVTISEVRVSPDLKHAICYAARLGGGDDAALVKSLNRASKFLRGRLGKEMEMKSTPALRFVVDESFETAQDMQKLLQQPHIKQDLEAE